VLLGSPLSNSLLPVLHAEEITGDQADVVEMNSGEVTDQENSSEANNEEKGTAYDVQPTTAEEIELMIASYKEQLERKEQAVKPHWEFAVEEAVMPSGYECVEVDDDAEFDGIYYTFKEEENIFDTQPTSLAEVQKLIAEYEEEFRSALDMSGFEEAVKVRKPHWKYAVKDEFMPDGYNCQEVTGDEAFTSSYYTFFAEVMAMAGSWSGSGTSGDPYRISTAAQLKELSDEVAAGSTFSGEYFIITADLNMSSYSNWVPIGSSSTALSQGYYQGSTNHPITAGTANAKVFSGTIDGQGHTISNLTSSGTGAGAAPDYRGVFGITNNATIKNLTINNANITGGSGLGALVGLASGNTTIENCHAKNSTVNSNVGGTRLSTGGLIGEINFERNNVVRILGCSAAGTAVTSNLDYGTVGGLIGNIRSAAINTSNPISNMNADILVNGCSVSGGSVNAYRYYVGGMIGQVLTQATGGNTIKITDCTTDIPVQTSQSNGYYVGGIFGQVWVNNASTNNDILIKNCHAYGSVTGRGYYVGGLAGFLEMFYSSSTLGNSITIEGSSAHGNISGNSYFNGGLLGHIHNGVVVKNSWATGNVTGAGYGNGGLIGHSLAGAAPAYGRSCEIINSYASGHVSGPERVGGLVGWDTSSNFKNSYATGSAKGNTATYVGGLIGLAYGYDNYYTKMENCYATGTVLPAGNTASSGGFVGGFMHLGSANITMTNCFYDTTTTQKSAARAAANSTRSGVTGVTTGWELSNAKGMINVETFSSWNVKNNINGAANGAGSESDPWYIDDKVTYPYLWYQYDGHTKEEVNYNLSTAKYSFTSGSVTGKHIAPRRADFLLTDAGTNQATYYNVKTSGAQQVYFPYLAQSFGFGGQSEIRVPASGSHTVANATTPYSMGGISATDIISFDPLPYAEKTSDRTAHQEGVESTYTIRGDLVEYKVTITNPSIRYEWLDVVLKDPLPEGVTLVEGLYNGQTYDVTVKVNDGQAVSLPKDAAETATGPYYYTYTKAMSSSETDAPLVVYLGDFPTATELSGGGVEMYVVEVTFTAIIDRRAVSQFPLNDPQNIIDNGDNIRNTGTVDGTIREAEDHSNTFPYEADFDDKNTDPVYDSYKVSYIGNSGKTDAGDLKYDEYYLYNKTFTVNDNMGTPFQFNRLYYLFLGEWYSRAEKVDGATVTYDIGSTYGLSSNKNPIPSGFRDPGDEMDDVYDDYYALTDFKLYAPWKEQTGSIKVVKENEKGEVLEGARFLLEKEDGTDWIGLKWDDTAKEWVTLMSTETYTGETDTAGQLILGKDGTDNTLPFGTYRLTEVKSPSGYSLLKEPIIIELPYEKLAASDPADDWDIKYVNSGGDTVYSYFNLTYTVSNVGAFSLPESGNMGIPWFVYGGALAVFAAAASITVRYLHNRRRRQNFQK